MIFFILAFIAIALIDLPPLIKRKQRREIIVFCCFYVVTLIIIAMQLSGVNFPSPLMAVSNYMKQTLGLTY